ncbi:hypothetical protein PIB30_027169 [Stylosanthes scabra]|uniref:Uncharacterized protein n=1 Tax=Stylosanthes scabra TaxID=79078 RepID=A0ABU6QA40_9FABA|nr:hypothetical protein [Stylosanthes scabra]
MLLRLTVQRNEPVNAKDYEPTEHGRFESAKGPRHLTVGEPYLSLLLSNRRVREVNRCMSSWPTLGAGMHHIVLTPFFSHYAGLLLSPSYLSYTMRPIAPRPPRPAVSPSSSASSGSIGSIHRERERSPCTPLPLMAPAPAPGFVYPIPRTPMSDARHYRSLFSRRRVTPPTPPPPSPLPSDDEPSVETFDPAAELEGDPDEPYIADHVPIGAPEAYYSDASYGSEQESANTDSAPSSHHSSGSSSGSVSLGYGSASSGLTSDGALDDDLVNRYFAGTFPPP